MMPILDNTLKVSLVLCIGFTLSVILRRRSAATRHWVLAITLVCAAAVPLVEPRLPSWGLPAREIAGPATANEDADAIFAIAASTGIAPQNPELAGPSRQSPGWIVAAVALLGSTASGLVLVVGLLRLVWLARCSQPIASGPWAEHAVSIARECGLRRRIRLLEGTNPSLLVTWGVIRPHVIVPRTALAWSDDRIRVVLRHELAHIQRGDWLVQLAGEAVRAVYWFNPLVWVACRRLREESERACDDAVLKRVDAPEYAAHLLELARTLKAESTAGVPAPAVVATSSLERRIKAMLDVTLVRTPATRTLRFATAGVMVALTIGIAAAQVGPSVLSGSVVDDMGASVPGVRVTLVNERSRARFEVATDVSGRYEFVPLPADDYLLLAAYPAFESLQNPVALSGRAVRRDLRLTLGGIREHVSVHGRDVFRVENGDVVSPDGERLKFKVFEVRPGENDRGEGFAVSIRGQLSGVQSVTTGGQRTADACEPSAIGGRVRPPAKIKHVKPVYPAQITGTPSYGEVELTGIIGADGSVRDLRIARSVQRDLDAAALQAVSQWQFESPLLNCRPVDVPFSVTVDFGIQ